MSSRRQLNFHHLYYFWRVAKELHLTRAAEQLHVSQSALSLQIRKLEDSLGQALFLREGRSLQLTDFGNLVMGYAENIFDLGDELLAAVEGADTRNIQRLRIGSVSTLSRNFQENFLKPVLRLEQISIVHESAGFEDLIQRLRVHKLDLVLSNRSLTSMETGALRCRRIARQRVCLVGPPRKKRQAFRWPEDLQDQRLLLPGPSSDIRNQFNLMCEELNLAIRPHAEVDDMAMLRLMARDSGGLAVVPDVVVQDELDAGLLEIYAVLPDVFETFYAITAQRMLQPALLQTLLNARR
ncbi:LysR family transcriptional regulator [Chromatocurvus halotolerans]|uniref:LysR family transcriptional regulator n=1 Tax=Chromatocurvus halotolerans TaxID=1132028 RepID=A0A4R2KTS4_9GAMM|nr:LysR substrate-binding domain-containing protein [Chromatocurvus halotolerans]TCO74506.1 LysR family transcriptional regulator [Chromatocurvus halotolerans]